MACAFHNFSSLERLLRIIPRELATTPGRRMRAARQYARSHTHPRKGTGNNPERDHLGGKQTNNYGKNNIQDCKIHHGPNQ